MQNEYGTNKLASIPLSLLLIVSGLFGFVLLVPLGAAHASGTPTVTVTPNSATANTAITISGTGFASDSAVQITSQVASSSSSSGSVTVQWLVQGDCGQTNGGTSGAGEDSLIGGVHDAYPSCLVTDATGSFSVIIDLPALPGGPQTVNVQDSATTPNKATASITVTPSMILCTNDDSDVKCTNNSVTDDVISSGYPLTDVGNFFFLINGFGQQDSVSLSSSVFQSGFSPSCTTNNLGQCQINAGSGTLTGQFIVAEAVGGVHSITASGASLSASTSFTILPWVNFYNSLTGSTSFSFVGTAPTSVLIEGHGFAASSTIAANSITIGGVSTTHASVKTSSKGAFGVGAGNQLTVSPVSGVPFGPVDVVIAGTTFNYASHNINQGATGPYNIRPSPGHNVPRLGGILISTTAGVAAHGTAVGLLDSTVHYFADNVYFWGYGFVPSHLVSIDTTNLGSISGIGGLAGTIQTLTADGNGAIFATSESGSLDSPEAQGSYQVTFTQASGPANIVSPSYTATATLYLNQFDTGDISGGIIYQPAGSDGGWCTSCSEDGSTDVVQAEFFAASSTVTVTVGGNTLASGSTDTNGEFQTNTITQTALDLAAGTWTATASDGTNSATDTFATNPIVTGPGFGGHALTTSGPAKAGTYTTLLTTANYGVHGLLANAVYNVNWGLVGATGVQTVGTFTSTDTGGIPIPGVQIQIPAGSVGDHIITLVQNGSDYLLANSFEELPTSAGPTSIYGDVVFVEQVSINVLPSVANVGQMVTLSGTGLSGTTNYEVTIDNNPTPQNGQILGTFTTDASGNIPSSVSVTFPVNPANATMCGKVNNYPEEASTYFAHVQTAKQYGGGLADGSGIVVLAANVALNATSAAAGHSVSLTANGLCAEGTYNVVFNYAENSQATGYSGTVVAAFAADSNGAGSTTFSVPGTASQGAYTLQLVRLAPTQTALGVLSVPPTLIVTPSSSGVCNTTGCFTAGTATQSLIGQFQTVVVPYTNNANTAVTGVVYGVVTNPAGQTVYYTTATITPGAGQAQTAYLTLSGLPHGTYTVNYFVTNTGGVAISASNSITVTL